MKKIVLLICFLTAKLFFGQVQPYGTYSTNWGDLKVVCETGFEYPGGGIFYGDYKQTGTIVGYFGNNAKEIEGDFHNGADPGKFFFSATPNFIQGPSKFFGNWGYQTNNKYSQKSGEKWDGTKKNNSFPTDLKTNVWSGKWNTNHGYLILQQVGNKVTGKYKTVGDVNATYNPQTQKLAGTFTNGGRTGYLELNFEGNSFKGKWGWTAAMTEGKWDGTKHLKTNKEVISVDFINKVIGEWNYSSTLNGQKVCNKIKIENRGTLIEPKLVVIVINPTQSFLDFSGYNSFTSSEFNLLVEKSSNTTIPSFLFYEIGPSVEINSMVTKSFITLIPQFNQSNQLINLGVSLNQRVTNKKTKVENSTPIHINNFIK
jgi:hypothetical protein